MDHNGKMVQSLNTHLVFCISFRIDQLDVDPSVSHFGCPVNRTGAGNYKIVSEI